MKQVDSVLAQKRARKASIGSSRQAQTTRECGGLAISQASGRRIYMDETLEGRQKLRNEMDKGPYPVVKVVRHDLRHDIHGGCDDDDLEPSPIW